MPASGARLIALALMFIGGAILTHIDDDVAYVPLVFGVFFFIEYFFGKGKSSGS